MARLKALFASGSTILIFFLFFLAGTVLAHDGVVHNSVDETVKHQEETTPNTSDFPDVKGGDFELVDHNGNLRTSKNPDGHYQLIFFGYANCKAICSVALPRVAEAVDELKKLDVTVTPLLITIDPKHDTVENMKESVTFYHKDMIGLTGTEAQLEVAYKAFNVEKSLIYVHPEEGPIYAHGSFIYLVDGQGNFQTLLPPILGAERIAEVVKGYISGMKY